MPESSRFEIGGTTYEVRRLKVKDSLAGLKLVGKVLAPALGEAARAPDGQIGHALERVVDGLDCLPQLLDLFAPATKFVAQTGSLVELGPFVEDQFAGRPDLCVEFIARAVQAEYGAFFSRPEIAALTGRVTAATKAPA